MGNILYANVKTRALENAEGSDGRLNTTARVDTRAYYNSRDDKETYSVPFDHQVAAAGEFSLYIQNTSTSKEEIIVSFLGLNSANNSRIKLWFVTGIAAGGTVITATNSNKGASNDAAANIRQAAAGDAITGLTEAGQIGSIYVLANSNAILFLNDTIRLGQNDAIAIEYDEGTSGDMGGTLSMFFE